MATTVSYSASMRTRKATSSSNYLSSAASQEYYDDSYNFVGILNFSGMDLTNKVITNIVMKFTSAQAGYGAGHTKTVYVRKSRYQAASQSGITGANYFGDALGTFTGSFYGNTTSYSFNSSTNAALFAAMAAYFAEGNNTITIYNPSPTKSSQGYSTNYLQWNTCTMTITYEEAASQPTVSSTSVDLGTAVTITTNRLSTSATHTISYTFGSASGTIATSVEDSVSWTPPHSLASQIPSATSAPCTITCQTYYGGVLTGTKTCSLTLNVPSSVVPSISDIECEEAVGGITAQFGGFVQSKSKLSVSVTAAGSYGSTISSVRSSLNGTVYSGTSFTTGFLNVAGSNTMTITVTDSRGRTASSNCTFTVLAYSQPSLTSFSAQRCNTDGTAVQVDGTHVRITVQASAASVNSKNTMSCTVYYKLSTAESWTQATTITPSNYAVNSTNLVLPQTYNVLNSYDLKVRVQDYFYYIEQSVSIGTKTVLMDFYHDGSGIAFGKVAETANTVEFGLPIKLSTPLAVAQGGTGATTAASACSALGALPKSGGTMTGKITSNYESLPGGESGAFEVVTSGGEAVFKAQRGSVSVTLGVGSSGTRHGVYSPTMGKWLLVGDTANSSVHVNGTADNVTGVVAVANGGTGGSTAKAAMNNLGIFYSATLPSTGTDGQICLVPV